MTSTRDTNPKDVIDVPGWAFPDGRGRKVVVAANRSDGVHIVWYDPDGVGPHVATLPHCSLHQTLYENESHGQHRHYSKIHPDFTGKSGEI